MDFISRRVQIDVSGKYRTWFSISSVIVLIGLFALLFTSINTTFGTNLPGLNLGIDFTGGSLLTLDFADPVSESQVRTILLELNLSSSSVQLAKDANDPTQLSTVIIRTPPIDEAKKEELKTELRNKVGSYDTISDDSVHAAVSNELRSKALWALLIASIFMVIYITIRFEFKFAIAAIIAIVHDALAVIGLFALIRFPISISFIAALLTIIGYSINDTIVVFDRIREKLRERHKESLATLVNQGIAETLTRSINTSLTTLFTITSVLLFGGTTVREFSLAMFAGIIVGTYSSIFIASTVWLLWKQKEVAAHQNS